MREYILVYGITIRPTSSTAGLSIFSVRATDEPYPQTGTNGVYWNANNTYAVNQWYDIVINAKLDSTTAGYFKVWINGTQVVNYFVSSYYRGHGPGYVKFGQYNGWRTRDVPGEVVNERTVYHDN